MYATTIGRHFVKRANERDGQRRTPREYFDDVFYPLVFGDDQYLMTPAQNSPPAQLVSGRKRLERTALSEGRSWDDAERSRLRAEALSDLHDKAAEVSEPLGHLVLGGYTRDGSKQTSGQITGLDQTADSDDVYLSWIGAACGIGVSGGLVLLIDHHDVFDALAEGWQLYRTVLSESPNLKPNQLETWNGQWLRHRLSAEYRPDVPKQFVQIALKKDGASFSTVSWARLLFSLGRTLESEVTAYVYSLGQMNTTIGFVPIHLRDTDVLREDYRTLRHFYHRLFGKAAADVFDSLKDIDAIYDAGTHFADVCAQGAIGLRAFEPARLSDFLPSGKNKQPKPVTATTAQTYLLYQTWIYAMLGEQKNALYDRAALSAQMLLDFEASAMGGKTNLMTSVKNTLKVEHLSPFVASLSQIAEEVQNSKKVDYEKLDDEERQEMLDQLDALVRVCIDMTPERFKLFMALLRFQIAFQQGKAEASK
jgi:hypothetical protein